MNLRNLLFAAVLILPISGGAQEPNPLMSSWPECLDHKGNTPFRLNWISLGPVINSARVDAVQCDPTRPGTWYAGFGSGNLWKTTDHGLTWKPVFEDQPALSIGNFTLAPSNPDIMYASRWENYPGICGKESAVYKTTGGGVTWKRTHTDDLMIYAGLGWYFSDCAVNPKDDEEIYLLGIRMAHSSNGGQNFDLVEGDDDLSAHLFVSEDLGKNWSSITADLPDETVNCIAEDPLYENFLYAGLHRGVFITVDRGKRWSLPGINMAATVISDYE